MVLYFLVAKIIGTAVALTVLLLSSSLHSVREGHVGVYWHGGALHNATSDPGFHLKMPFITSWEEVQITVQTDEVRNIPCGTSGGVLIHFDKVREGPVEISISESWWWLIKRLRPEEPSAIGSIAKSKFEINTAA